MYSLQCLCYVCTVLTMSVLCLLPMYNACFACTTPTMPAISVLCLYYSYYACLVLPLVLRLLYRGLGFGFDGPGLKQSCELKTRSFLQNSIGTCKFFANFTSNKNPSSLCPCIALKNRSKVCIYPVPYNQTFEYMILFYSEVTNNCWHLLLSP